MSTTQNLDPDFLVCCGELCFPSKPKNRISKTTGLERNPEKRSFVAHSSKTLEDKLQERDKYLISDQNFPSKIAKTKVRL